LFPSYSNAEIKNKIINQNLNDVSNLNCDNIDNQECIARALEISACSLIYEINDGKSINEAFQISNKILIKNLRINNLKLLNLFEKDGLIKKEIQVNALERIGFCKEEIKLAIPKLIKSIDKKTKLNKSQIEKLADEFPSYYLSIFKQKT